MDDKHWASVAVFLCLSFLAIGVGLGFAINSSNVHATRDTWQRAAISRGYATWQKTSDGDTEFVWVEREADGDD